MKKDTLRLLVCVILGILLNLSLSDCVLSEEGEAESGYDESATAESLGLEPLVLPDDYYPLYMWDHWPGKFEPVESSLTGMTECNLTTSSFVLAEHVPLCEQLGLKCLVESGVDCHGLKEKTQEEVDELLRPVLEATRDSEAVVGYFLIDEPGADEFAGLAKAVSAVKRLAPGKFAYINLFPGYASKIGANAVSQLQTKTFTEYLERFVQEVRPQCLSYDNYMVEYSEDMSHEGYAIAYYSDLLEVRRIAAKYEIPFWNIVSSMSIEDTVSSPPNASRLAFQAYTSLAAGADGLGWFLYSPEIGSYTPVDNHGEQTIIWDYLRAVNRQVRTLGAILNQYESTYVGFSGGVGTEGLPGIPGQLVADVETSFSPRAGSANKPDFMLGEFKAKNGTASAFMVVNLDFTHSIKVEPRLVDESRTFQVLSPVTGKVMEKPRSGWWILPGHGMLFLVP